GLAVELDREFAFVLGEYSGALPSGSNCGASQDPETGCNPNCSGFHGATYPRTHSLWREQVSQRRDALRFRIQQYQGGEWRLAPPMVRQSCPRDGRRVDTREGAARKGRGSWLRREKADGRSWSYNARGGLRSGNPARARERPPSEGIPGSRIE